MTTPTLYLDVLFMGLLSYPSGISQIIAMIFRPRSGAFAKRYLEIASAYLLFLIGLSAVELPFWDYLRFFNGWIWPLIAILSGGGLIYTEFLIGYTILKVQHKNVAKRMEIATDWKTADRGMWFVTMLYAILEEILYHGLWPYLLIVRAGVPGYMFVFITGILYGLNHLRMGTITFVQKVLSGAVLSLLFVWSGYSIWIPLLAHLAQNSILMWLSYRIWIKQSRGR
ncbi:MAG: CPBP family intramembrane metalloprotease [Tissierellia bacterium]|nr:CPBP family intramembrane metalloprotease [Tissierellia bacterium]